MSNSSDRYPPLYAAASKGAEHAQRVHLWLTKSQLVLLTMAALASGFDSRDAFLHTASGWTLAAAMTLALTISVAQRVRKYDDLWFASRALAENTKSTCWRFATQRTPANATENANAELAFAERMRTLRERFPAAEHALARYGQTGGREITEWMRALVKQGWREKVSAYRKERLEDQIAWYQGRASFNATRENVWFWILLVFEFAALVIAFAFIQRHCVFNPIGAIATVSSGIVAWVNAKRFSDLATAYAVAAEDLRVLAVKFDHVDSSESLQAAIDGAEDSISREHRVWLSQRLRRDPSRP